MNSSDFDPAPAQSRNVLFGLARSLHRHPDADRLLEEITREILNLVDAQGTTVLLLDHDTGEFFFSAAAFRSQEIENKIQNMRFPKDKGVAGRVLETGKPVMVNDTRKNPWFFREVDRGGQVFFVWGVSGMASIWRIPFNGGAPVQLTNAGLRPVPGTAPEGYLPVPHRAPSW